MSLAAQLLSTDLYQLTMAQAYLEHGKTERACFEFFIRDLPPKRAFFVACGIEPLLEDLVSLRLTDEELAFLQQDGRFSEAFLSWLADYRFTGDVDAVDEGEIVFAGEPILRVCAPLPVAQIVETLVINRLQYSTLIASKAARVRIAAKDAFVVDFGLRRAHGLDAGLWGARAAYIGGLDGTSNVAAGMRWHIPIFGTMAHSFVQSYEKEADAFAAFAKTWPQATTLLVDTYDTLTGVDTAIELAHKGVPVRGVRIDSGDLGLLAREARRMLDAAGLHQTKIFVSGNLDEYVIDELLARGAPIDGFGVGTKLLVSADCPYLDCAYKLQQIGARPVFKKSAGKATLPGIKQLFRRFDEDGRPVEDIVATADESIEGARALLSPAIRQGEIVRPIRPAGAIRDAFLARLAHLPTEYKQLEAPKSPYPVRVSEKLRMLAQRLRGD